MMSWLKEHYFQLQVIGLASFKSTELFERINQLDWYQHLLHRWVDDQNYVTGSSVLEAGCATGALNAYVAQLGHFPTGVDASSDMIARAKTNHPDIKFLEADVYDLPFESESFDAVIATSLVNIVDDKSAAVEALSRICKKGGKVSVLVPSAQFSKAQLDALRSSIINNGGSGFSVAAMEVWLKRAPKMQASELEAIFEKIGLTKIKTDTYLDGLVISTSAVKAP